MAQTTKGSSRKTNAGTRSSKSDGSRRAKSGRRSTANRNGKGSNAAAVKRASTPKSRGAAKKTVAKRASGSAATRASRSAGDVSSAVEARQAAVAGTKAAGHAVAGAVGRARTPLIVGGALIAGVVGGVAAKSRAGLRPGRRRLAGAPLPTWGGKLDLDAVASTARRVSVLGQQVADVAAAFQAADERNHK
jgi:hypothetical protein